MRLAPTTVAPAGTFLVTTALAPTVDTATHGDVPQNFCPGSDVNPVFDVGAAGGKIPATQRDLVADHHVLSEAGVVVDDDAERMRQKGGDGQGHADVAPQQAREHPAHTRNPVPRQKNQRGSPAPVVDPGIFGMAAHRVKISGHGGRTRQKSRRRRAALFGVRWHDTAFSPGETCLATAQRGHVRALQKLPAHSKLFRTAVA